MKASIALLAILMVCGAYGGEESGGVLHREKKDIGKLQAIFGGWNKQKPYPIVNLEEFKRPVYYIPQQPCNCNWRPTTRYGEPPVYVPARPLVAIPPPPPGPVVIQSAPARAAPPPVISSAPALLDQPCAHQEGYNYDRPAAPAFHA